LIVVDAFSSDAIPIHLLTREAVELYRSRLRPGGLLVMHISNRYLDLEPVVARLAADAGWVCRSQDDWNTTPQELAEGKDQSHWVVLVQRKEDLGRALSGSAWLTPDPSISGPPWTDDFANILSVFKWR
jgi:hypothetical protein